MMKDKADVTQNTTGEDNLKRICLFGGTFDPIHLGHTHIAEAAVKALDLDQVVFLPCRQSPHKKGHQHASDHHRLRMCQLATEALNWATVDDFDITAPAPCYSWRTVEAMRKKSPHSKLYWLMGTDQWKQLPHWNRPEYLATMVDFIVFSRQEKAQPRTGYHMHPIDGNHLASATAIRKGLPQGTHKDWLNPLVHDYIIQNNLYESGPELH